MGEISKQSTVNSKQLFYLHFALSFPATLGSHSPGSRTSPWT